MEYVKTHGSHGANFDSHLTGFVSKKVAEEHSAYQAKERQEAEERSGQIREENRTIRAKAAAEAEAKMDVAARVRQGVKAILEVLEEEMTQHLQAGYRELTRAAPIGNLLRRLDNLQSIALLFDSVFSTIQHQVDGLDSLDLRIAEEPVR
jgi:hypothetical protein